MQRKEETDSFRRNGDAGPPPLDDYYDNTQELSESWHYIISLNSRGVIACKVDEARGEEKEPGFVLANWATFREKRREDVSKEGNILPR